MFRKKIVTHDGPFHADEVFGVAILKLLYPDSEVLRSRKQEDVDKADFRVDVGQKYKPEENFYDHHQVVFDEKRSNGIYYASSGLVWKHFGRDLANSKRAFEIVDEKLLQIIDARDSGMDVFDSKINLFLVDDVVKLYRPTWKEKNPDFDKGFKKALNFAKDILVGEIERANLHKEAEDLVSKAVKDKNQKYIVLDQKAPWKEIIVNNHLNVKFCIHPGPYDNWICNAAPVSMDSFEKRAYFPKEWRGLEREELQEASEVDDAGFCHRAGFIAAADSRKGAIKLVEKALEND
ncbi:MAG: MYG1 family protein [Candidatus Pacearchaeota archaeon]